ncbi:MAG: ATP-dependent DNA ligase [Candidatus Omnitrophica bacterium]|nr:ATP-dependent DNA ligase [Candidatus Omnitrophota bacterium]
MKFSTLADYFARIESTSKRLEMTDILAELFRGVPAADSEIDKIVYLCQGQLQASFDNVEFGMSEKLLRRSLAQAVGSTDADINALFQRCGDYGLVIEQASRRQGGGLTVTAVYDALREIAAVSGSGSVQRKISLVGSLLGNLSGGEAKYVVRVILGRLRLGVGDPTVLDALSLAAAADKSLRPSLERAYNLCSDLGRVARILFEEGIEPVRNFQVIVGCPIRVALAARLNSPEDIIEKIGTCAVEYKYDGFRCQIHKDGGNIRIFSRNLEDMTAMFPELRAAAVEQIGCRRAIFEGEAVAFDPHTGKTQPFQVTVQRKRKHDIAAMQRDFPLQLYAFDLLYTEPEGDITERTYEQRRDILSRIVAGGRTIQLSPFIEVSDAGRLQEIFEDAVSRGYEGIVVKRPDSTYRAGGRNFNWIKLKRSYSGNLNDTIDCAVVGFYFGKGSRTAAGIGSLLVCVYDERDGRYKTVAKVGSGFSEAEMKALRGLFADIQTHAQPKDVDSVLVPDVWVQPRYVVAVQADEITRSPVHTCAKDSENAPGLALRFPRMAGFPRADKQARDATTVEEIRQMFSSQGRLKAA